MPNPSRETVPSNSLYSPCLDTFLNWRPRPSMVLKEVRRGSFDDFLRVKKFPDLLTKILRGFFWQFYVDFCILSPSACNVDLQGIPIYATSNVDVHVVSLYIACSVDVEGVSISTASCILLQGVSSVHNCRVYQQFTSAGCIPLLRLRCCMSCRVYLSPL